MSALYAYIRWNQVGSWSAVICPDPTRPDGAAVSTLRPTRTAAHLWLQAQAAERGATLILLPQKNGDERPPPEIEGKCKECGERTKDGDDLCNRCLAHAFDCG